MTDIELEREFELCRERLAQLEDKLVHSEMKWRNVLEYMPQIGVSLNPAGDVVYANQHFLDLTGWAFEEIYLQSWFDLFVPEGVRDQVRDVFPQTMQQQNVWPHPHYPNPLLPRRGSSWTPPVWALT